MREWRTYIRTTTPYATPALKPTPGRARDGAPGARRRVRVRDGGSVRAVVVRAEVGASRGRRLTGRRPRPARYVWSLRPGAASARGVRLWVTRWQRSGRADVLSCAGPVSARAARTHGSANPAGFSRYAESTFDPAPYRVPGERRTNAP